MLSYIAENLGSIIVGAIVTAILILVTINIIRNKSSSSCSCGGCKGCVGFETCNIKKTDEDEINKSSEIQNKQDE